MVTSPILSMLLIPAAFRLLERHRLRKRKEQHSLQLALIPTSHNHAGFPDGIAGLELLRCMAEQACK